MQGKLAVPIGQLEAGALPPVCVKSGRDATRWESAEFAAVPAWTYALLLFGVLPFLLVRLTTGTRVKVKMPASRNVAAQRWAVAAVVAVSGIAAVLLLLAAPLASSVALGVASGMLFVVAISTYLLAWPRVWVRGTIRGGEVVLRGVHPAFAAATAEITRRGPGSAPAFPTAR